MIVIIICLSILGLSIAAFLGYVGVDSLLKNKKETTAKPSVEEPKSLYRVRSYSFAYKEEGHSPESLFCASLLYPSEQEGSRINEGSNEERR